MQKWVVAAVVWLTLSLYSSSSVSKFGPAKILLFSLSWITFRAAGFDKPRVAARRCDEVNRIGNVQPSTDRTSHPSCRKWANCWACWPGTTPPPAARRRSTTSTWTLKVRYLHVLILLLLEICPSVLLLSSVWLWKFLRRVPVCAQGIFHAHFMKSRHANIAVEFNYKLLGWINTLS